MTKYSDFNAELYAEMLQEEDMQHTNDNVAEELFEHFWDD